jgi:phage virion morphogenesis protein
MIKLKIELNDAELRKLLDKLSDASLLNGIAKEAAHIVESITVDALEAERSPDGSGWAPYAGEPGEYAALKQRQGKSPKMLEAWRNMRLSLRVEDSDGATSSVALNAVSEDGYPYPAAHQFGAPKVNIPARPFLPITPDKDDLMDIAKDRIRNAVTDIVRRLL